MTRLPGRWNRRSFLKGISAACALMEIAPAAAIAKSVVAQTSSPPARSFSGYYFGWIRDLPTLKTQEQKVFSFSLQAIEAAPPPAVDLRPAMPPVYDQGQIGSCVANAVAALVQYVRRLQGQSPDFVPSRLYVYYFGRALEGTVATDPGMQIRDGIRVVESKGVCAEKDWPYDAQPADTHNVFPTSNNRAVVRPPTKITNSAYAHRTISAGSLEQRLDTLKGCLAQGYPFAFGFTIYPSFFDTNQRPLAHVPTPDPSEIPVSGHAVVAVGYDDTSKTFTCRTSWGVKNEYG